MKYIVDTDAVIRIPYYPITVIKKAFHDHSYFLKVVSSDEFMTALLFSSESLFNDLQKLLNNNLSEKEKVHTETSLIKYLSRMSSRCTPFGSYASCGAVAINGINKKIEIPNQRILRFRFDMSFMQTLFMVFQKDITTLTNLRFKSNDTLYLKGGRVRYHRYTNSSTGRQYSMHSVKATGILKFLLRITSSYISFKEIVASLTSEYDITADEAKKYILDAFSLRIILCEAELNVLGNDCFTTLLQLCESTKSKLLPLIQQLYQLLENLNTADNFTQRYDIVKDMLQISRDAGISIDLKSMIQMDSFLPLKNASITNNILPQIQNSLKVLSALTPFYKNSNLVNFISAFKKKYENREMLLVEVLDTETGIGYAGTKAFPQTPLINEIKLPTNIKTSSNINITQSTSLLNQKLIESINNAYQPIDLKTCKINTENINPNLPPTMCASFKINGYNESSQTFTLSNVGFGGSCGVNLLGRFADGDNSIKSIVDKITTLETTAYKNQIIAEISHFSTYRTCNILKRPSIRGHEISICCTDANTTTHKIPVSDLTIQVINDRIILKSKKFNQEIIPRLTSAHNFNNSLNNPLYRFLCDLQFQGYRHGLSFYWGGLSSLYTHFPRVCYGDTILSYETWRYKKSDISQNKHISVNDVKEWIKSNNLPQLFLLSENDNKLLIDSSSDLSINTFISEIPADRDFTIEEFIESSDITISPEGEYYMNEFNVPLIKVKS